MTGFPIILRGLSFKKESRIARLTICAFQIAFFVVCVIVNSCALGLGGLGSSAHSSRQLRVAAGGEHQRPKTKQHVQKVVPAFISKCSTIGPRLRAGKNVSAPTITTTLTSNVVNRGVVTGNVPNDGGTWFLLARFPATASIGMIIMNRPMRIAIPCVVLYQ